MSNVFAGPSPAFVAITGAGGKTHLLHQLALEYGPRWPTIISTTTRIAPPNRPDLSPLRCDELFLFRHSERNAPPKERPQGFSPCPGGASAEIPGAKEDREDKIPVCGYARLLAALRAGKVAALAEEALGQDKLKGWKPDQLCLLWARLRADLPEVRLLVEADGAARLPLKAHAPHEPCIPACADWTIAGAGLDALRRPLRQVAHRCGLAAQRLRVAEDAPVSPDMMADLLLAPEGPFRGAGGRRAILLNKADLAAEADARAMLDLLRRRAPDIPVRLGQRGRPLSPFPFSETDL